jgi:hypothetical protein
MLNEGLCPSSGDINKLMMMMNTEFYYRKVAIFDGIAIKVPFPKTG